MNVGTIILDIVVFILSLGLLICLHEAGHLTAAKIFKVYCYEFSIGMGPLIYQHKPKKEKGQETAFSIRALPVGGYVSMAGEDLEQAEGVPADLIVPKERTMESKPRWQRIIIMAAGVTMNFLIGYVLLAINFTACSQTAYNYTSNVIEVEENVNNETSPAYLAGLRDGDKIIHIKEVFKYQDSNLTYDDPALWNSDIDFDVESYTYEAAPVNPLDYNKYISVLLSGTYYKEDGTMVSITPHADGDEREVTFTYLRNQEEKTATVTTKAYSYTRYFQKRWSWGTIGVGCKRTSFRYSFGQGLAVAGQEWGYYAGAIFRSLGSLFNPASWSQLSGIVGVFQVSSQATETGISAVLLFWGLISINLAIVNLLPFPGLDGWQILLTLIEYVIIGCGRLNYSLKHKEMPKEEKKAKFREESEFDLKKKKGYQKFKQIASTAGLVILLALAVVLIVKDIIHPVV